MTKQQLIYLRLLSADGEYIREWRGNKYHASIAHAKVTLRQKTVMTLEDLGLIREMTGPVLVAGTYLYQITETGRGIIAAMKETGELQEAA